jgi:PHD/YefM family antitoxin component YafN of YafNO toxin-antitoxin module
VEIDIMDSVSVPATEFSRNFAKYRDEAIEVKVINVTSHGRVIGGYLSASELARYEEMKRRERKVLIVGELDDETLAAIESAEYGMAPK